MDSTNESATEQTPQSSVHFDDQEKLAKDIRSIMKMDEEKKENQQPEAPYVIASVPLQTRIAEGLEKRKDKGEAVQKWAADHKLTTPLESLPGIMAHKHSLMALFVRNREKILQFFGQSLGASKRIEHLKKALESRTYRYRIIENTEGVFTDKALFQRKMSEKILKKKVADNGDICAMLHDLVPVSIANLFYYGLIYEEALKTIKESKGDLSSVNQKMNDTIGSETITSAFGLTNDVVRERVKGGESEITYKRLILMLTGYFFEGPRVPVYAEQIFLSLRSEAFAVMYFHIEQKNPEIVLPIVFTHHIGNAPNHEPLYGMIPLNFVCLNFRSIIGEVAQRMAITDDDCL